MPRVVVILPTRTYRASDFVSAAATSGIDLVVASEAQPPIDMGDRYLRIDCGDPLAAAEEIAMLGDRIGIDAVVAADDTGVVTAARANVLLGLSGNPPDAAEATRDKLTMRRRLASSEILQPRFQAIDPETDPLDLVEQIGFPMVIKPRHRSASQGVIRVDRPEDLTETIERVREIAGDDTTLIAEEYLHGSEVAVEGLVTNGELSVLAVFDKPDTSSGPYFPETIFVTPSRLEEADLAEVERVAGAAVRGLGLARGPVHIEMRVDRGRARLIEVAARSIGGLCSRSLNFGLMGTTLESLILSNALGTGPRAPARQPVATGVLMIPTPATGILRNVAGEEEVRQIPGVTGVDLTMVPGDLVVAPPEGERYLGFVYARGELPDQVESALRKAMDVLEVQLEG
ncbi:MAG TPA: ATP-grasp domain-containing protein [Acidimicrobiia bacterium]|nr:ATP-grasp domain-containing protein [Acidimicrobiia bacterium]